MTKKLVFIVGTGGREDAIRLALSDYKVRMFSNDDDVATEAKKVHPDLVIVGDIAPLDAGMSDEIRELGIPVFGPSRAAAQIEASKAFAEDFMDRYNISRPGATVITNKNKSSYKLPDDPTTIVIKANGLTRGHGVVLPSTKKEASDALDGMFSGELFSAGGKGCVVIQERLSGPELSVFALTDGTNYITLPYTQDHKRIGNGDTGPNTGGMGAYGPVPDSIVSSEQRKQIDDIIQKTLIGMKRDGFEYRGVLYLGLMLAEERGGEPVVIEYNARFGDPEAQVLIPLLDKSCGNFYELLESTDSILKSDLYTSDTEIGQAALTVCIASSGYPVSSSKSVKINGLDKDYKNVLVYRAGVKQIGSDIFTNGGRVLNVTGIGSNINEAAKSAYEAIGKNGIHFNGMQFRTDIGWQARSKDMLK